jgi:short-subunit dehydrogenase involved in D-alanine esterification of teichoic acids
LFREPEPRAHSPGIYAESIVNVTPMLGYLPLAYAAIYSATKSALHSWTMAQRFRLRRTAVAVVEIAPRRSHRLAGRGGATSPWAMPLADFVRKTMIGSKAARTKPGPDCSST